MSVTEFRRMFPTKENHIIPVLMYVSQYLPYPYIVKLGEIPAGVFHLIYDTVLEVKQYLFIRGQ